MTQFCCAYVLSRVRLCVTPWTVVHQALLSMGLLRQEYWSGLPFPFPGDLPDPGIKPTSPALVGGFFTTSAITVRPCPSYSFSWGIRHMEHSWVTPVCPSKAILDRLLFN